LKIINVSLTRGTIVICHVTLFLIKIIKIKFFYQVDTWHNCDVTCGNLIFFLNFKKIKSFTK